MIVLKSITVFVCLTCTGMCKKSTASEEKSSAEHRSPPLLGNHCAVQWPPSELIALEKYKSYQVNVPMLSKTVFGLINDKFFFKIQPFRGLYEVLIDFTREISIGHRFTSTSAAICNKTTKRIHSVRPQTRKSILSPTI